MKLIIDIPEIEYNTRKIMGYFSDNSKILEAVANGILIPDNATNERMVGKWIKSRDSYGTNHFTCPFCEHDIATKAENWDDNYCSNCGAKMESEARNEHRRINNPIIGTP